MNTPEAIARVFGLVTLRADALYALTDPLTGHFATEMKARRWPFVGDLFDAGAEFDAALLPVKADRASITKALIHAAVLNGGGPIVGGDALGSFTTVEARAPRYTAGGVTFGEPRLTLPLLTSARRSRDWTTLFQNHGEAAGHIFRREFALAADAGAHEPKAWRKYDVAKSGGVFAGTFDRPPAGPTYSAAVIEAASIPGDPAPAQPAAPVAPRGFADAPLAIEEVA